MSIDRTKFMSISEVKTLRESAEARCVLDLKKARRQGVLTWMLVDLALTTGLRVGEIVAIKVKDIDFKRKLIKVVRLKRKKPKPESLAINNKLAVHLKEYLESRTTGNLFIGKRGSLKRQALQVIWKRAIKRAGLPKELSIHCARHTLATHLLKKTGNLRFVQKQLGHASPATTAGFYADIAFEDMQDGLNGIYEQ